MPDFKLLPMGIADFRRIRRENYYYVDKTEWIPKFERVSSFLFFCRPRRFGKTLMLSVMESYYDCKQTGDWDRLFSGLWIHEHPTENRGQFQVMRLDFSRVGGNLDDLKEKFDGYVGHELVQFAKKYEDQYYEGFSEEVAAISDAGEKFNYINGVAKRLGNIKLYLILDEADRDGLDARCSRIAHAHSLKIGKKSFKIYKT